MTLGNAINKAKRLAMKHSKIYHVFQDDGEFFSCGDAMVEELWFGSIPVVTILEDGKQESI
jgi:hypothetical protein